MDIITSNLLCYFIAIVLNNSFPRMMRLLLLAKRLGMKLQLKIK